MRQVTLALSFALGLALAWVLLGRPVMGMQHQESRTTMTSTDTSNALPTARYSAAGYDITPMPEAEVDRLARALGPEVYRITRKSGTEQAFCGNLLDNKKDGVYLCVVCHLPLFSSQHKFTSGTGWPSFFSPFDPDHVDEISDTSHGMIRTEIRCARCSSHLGHVFDDGPRPTGLRFCLNSASLTFVESGEPMPEGATPVETQTAYFAGGCFWGIEHYFQMGNGVLDAESGYMQGQLDEPTYEDVLRKTSGHAETVKVVFDPKRISYERLLRAFFDMHDPTQLNRQGPDVGDQYRSGIWTTSDEQAEQARAFIRDLELSGQVNGKIVTQVEPAQTFWPAEEFHQDFIAKTGRRCHVKNPWEVSDAQQTSPTPSGAGDANRPSRKHNSYGHPAP
ncbi:MAG: bifunctional methionine sulfoxide reductase B/A protein [Phycisphaerales bacterium JB059]